MLYVIRQIKVETSKTIMRAKVTLLLVNFSLFEMVPGGWNLDSDGAVGVR